MNPLNLLYITGVLAGYPLFFASFEDVGESKVGTTIESFEDVDKQVTEWLTPCWADIFIVIKDMNPVDPVDLSRLKKFGQQSRTTGTFLTDYPIQLRELADDISIHCKAPFREIDIYAEHPTSQETNQRRTFYIEFDSSDRVAKSQVLDKVLAKLTTPYVTIIYSSSFGAATPMFNTLVPDPKRDNWKQRYTDHLNKQYKTPIVAPIVNEKKRDAIRYQRGAKPQMSPQEIAEYEDYLPDNLFAILFMGGVFVMIVLLLIRGIMALTKPKEPEPPKKPEPPKPVDSGSATPRPHSPKYTELRSVDQIETSGGETTKLRKRHHA